MGKVKASPWALGNNDQLGPSTQLPSAAQRGRKTCGKPFLRPPSCERVSSASSVSCEGAVENSGGLLLVWGGVEGDVVEQGGDEGEEQEGQ